MATHLSDALVLDLTARAHAWILRNGGSVHRPHRDTARYLALDLDDHSRDFALLRGERECPEAMLAWQRCLEAYRSGHTQATLPSLLEEIARVSALEGWESTPASFPQWTRPGSLESFRAEKRVGLSSYPTLPRLAEGQPIPAVARSDRAEEVQGHLYASRFIVSRQALFGDQAAALAREPAAAGRAARRTIEREAIAYLTSNAGAGPTMGEDGVALFHSTHGNLAASGAPPSVTTLDAARKAMRTRTSVSGEPLNVVPGCLLVPAALESVARTLALAQNTLTGDSEGDLEVAVSPWLDQVSATRWYLIGAPRSYDGIEVAYLGGDARPIVEAVEAWTQDGTELRVIVSFAVTALDWRSLYADPGV